MISIIIVNFRTPDDLTRLLTSLGRNPPSEPWETIVVDNDSRDDSADRAEAFTGVRVIRNHENRGFAAGVNRGIAEASGERVLLLNPDIEVLPGSIDALAGFLRDHPRAGLVAARLANPDGSLQHTCRTFYTLKTILLRRTFLSRIFPDSRALREHLMLDYDHETPREVDWVAGACMMVRREALDEVGPMDERYFLYFEDVDWCTRMHRRGWGVWYVPDSRMIHGYRRASAGGLNRAARAHAGSLLRFWEKWSAVLYLLRRYGRGINTALFVVADLAAINLAFLAAWMVRQELAPLLFQKPLFSLSHYWPFLLTTNLVALYAFAMTGLYRVTHGDWLDTLFAAGKALFLTCLILLASIFILQARSYSRLIVLSFWPLALVAVTAARRAVSALLNRFRIGHLGVHRMALVGRDERLDRLAGVLRSDPGLGYEPVRLNDLPVAEPEVFRAMMEDERVSDVVFATAILPELPHGGARHLDLLKEAGIAVHFSGPLPDLLSSRSRVGRLAGQPLLALETAGAASTGGVARRLFDGAVAALLVIVYLFPALALGVLLFLGGRRPRFVARGSTGGGRTPVRVLEWTADGWGGMWLRRLSLDRLPGLPAVIAGRLSLVGPSLESGGPSIGPAADRFGLFQPPGVFSADRPESGGVVREVAAEPIQALDWSGERDLKIVVRDMLARLRGVPARAHS